ncbi:MAG TPA: glycosyl hydrolase family 65 protein, partial [Isosphaeraceae bacterium]
IFSIRRRVHLEPGGSAMVAFGTAVVRDRDEALVLAALGREPSNVARAFDMAWAQSQVEHRHRRWSPEEAVRYQRLGAHLVFAGPAQRSDPGVIAANAMGQSGLWRAGVSGDRPIALVRLTESEELPLAAEVLDAHAYLRHKGLPFDLVLLDERPSSYNDVLHEEMMDLVRSSHSADLIDQPGGVFVRDADALGPDVTTLLQAAARVVLVGGLGPLAAQLDRVERPRALPSPLETTRDRDAWDAGELAAPADLAFANGLGGFTPDGREYVVLVRTAESPATRRNGKPKREPAPRLVLPPAPWVNVVANASGGFIVSESGSGYTWAANSQANRLTPWSNDPVSDRPGEVVYLRDEDTGAVWCPTPLPVADAAPVLVRHGQGYTTFERRTHGLDHALTLFVPHEDPVKVVRLVLTNHGETTRRISATYYAEWILGTTRDGFAAYVATEVDEDTGALFAKNPYNVDFAGRVAFLDVDRRPRTLTGDRAEFLGRNGSVAMPAAMARAALSGRVGAGLDPCGAVQAAIELAPGESTEVVFLIGQGDNLKHARDILNRHRDPAGVGTSLETVKAQWDGVLGAIEVKTPDPALDLMVNRWLIYQALSCRVWGRSAFYQSGGAFGFRDQLQDSMALVYGAPAQARAQLLLSASRQFLEGDVQHWWHPPTGVGVRTRISDDYLWLPYVAAHYVTTSGDGGVLDEVVPFLDAPTLRPDQEEDYGKPAVSQKSATLYEHCTLALERGTSLIGQHGLPLMGTGDWNDGMNRVGDKMKGESVWLGWFLIAGLTRFAGLSEERGDSARAGTFRAAAESLRAAVEKSAWDGRWYRRAYFDDGTPLGSAQNDECRIDSIAQSWAVISGAGDPERARQAMAEVDAQLVKPADRMILLFTPPFDHGKLHPGYIKGYLPGIRENGGQYTHAATWTVLAAAMQGRGDHAHELLDYLNPVRHAADPEGVERYKVEPYVVVADVYSRPPHVGRGGWTWYTGSASWLWRVAVEDVLGFRLRGDRLIIEPCLPTDWAGFELTYRYRSATYRVVVGRGVASVSLDGQNVEGGAVPLA